MWARDAPTLSLSSEVEKIRGSIPPLTGHLLADNKDTDTHGRLLSGESRVVEYGCGETYEGVIVSGLKEGYGIYKWATGAVYEGEWKRNVPSGTGRYSWPDGESYEGGFLYGQRHGAGMYTFSDGTAFVGSFRNDAACGRGVCTLPGGRTFHGEFALLTAYLRASAVRRSKKPADKWVHLSWPESNDLIRNPPWHGYSAVRPGRRHFDDGFSSIPSWAAAPVLEPRAFG
jgi:hypothetical protein